MLRQIGINNFKVVVSDFEEDLPHAQYRYMQSQRVPGVAIHVKTHTQHTHRNGAEYAKATARHKAIASASKVSTTRG